MKAARLQASKRAQANALEGVPVTEVCILKNLSEVDPDDDRRMEGMQMWRELFSTSHLIPSMCESDN